MCRSVPAVVSLPHTPTGSHAAAWCRYADAAALRDQLRPLEEQSRSVAQEAEQWQCLATAPKFRLGQMVVHASKGYRGVVCGWDGMCCEDTEWQAAAGVRCVLRIRLHLLQF